MTAVPALTLTASLRSAALDARRGIVRVHPEVAAALGLRAGDPVRLIGRRATAGIVAIEAESSRALLHADDLTLGNLGVRDGGEITVEPAPLTAARAVTVTGQPEVTTVVSPEMLRLALLGKMVTVGDDVSLLPQDVAGPNARRSLSNVVGWAWTTVLLKVVATEPDSALVTMDTVVRWERGGATHSSATPRPTPATTEDAAADVPDIADLAGLRDRAEQLRELLDLGFHHRDVLDTLGTTMRLGILVTGPAGSGKSTLVRAVAHELGAAVTSVWAPDLAALEVNAAAARLRQLAENARVLLVSDVDAVVPRDEPGPLATVFRQVARELLDRGAALVCTTSRPEAMVPGLLDHEIVVPLPDLAARRELLDVLTRRTRLAEDVALDEIAGRTPGFVAADLLALVREAGVRAALRHRGDSAGEKSITAADFGAALEVVRPTSMADSSLEMARVSLDDVGDMVEVKQVLTEAVLWPLTYPDSFSRLGIEPPRGVLLYGPPGCGKTFLVKAIAGSGKANVLSVKGSELLTKWVGESERAVRDLFRRARQAAPTLVFLDEVDALAPVRGQATDGGVTDRVVAALLTELDGIESLRNVVVIGATNRPDLVDPALLRPGRLERLIFVPPPDADARTEILRAAARAVPLAADTDLAALGGELAGFSAADCTALIRESALAAMRDSLDATEVTAAHVAAARERVRPSLDRAQVAALEAYAHRRVS